MQMLASVKPSPKIPMFLYLLRHADAVAIAPSDNARELTEKGVAQARQAGRFCKRRHLSPEIILTSPLRRAEQTARLVAGELGNPDLVTVAPFAASGMQPGQALKELKEFIKLESVMLVGHEPDLGQLAMHLLETSRRDKIEVRKGALMGIELEGFHPENARLHFSIPVELM
jgi:phosphohistidine phosphatase